MDLYKVKNNKLEQVDRESFKLEKEIQSFFPNLTLFVNTLNQGWIECFIGG